MLINNDNTHANELKSNFRHFGAAHTAKAQPMATDEKAEATLTGSFQDFLDSEAAEDMEHEDACGLPKSEIEVVKAYISKRYDSIRTNMLTKKIELTIMNEKKELTERTVNGWLNHLWSYETYTSVDGRNGRETVKRVRMDKNKLYTLIDNDDFAPVYDPVDEYFRLVAPLAEGTKAMPETEKFIRCFTCDNEAEVVDLYFKAWLAGVFTNYYSNHDKFDSILIMQSKQGTGKTTAIEHHLLRPFRDYVVKNFDWNTSNKDEMIKLATSLFIFDDELSATKKSEVEELKTITSLKPINNIRAPYARTTENYIRRASFIGATNNTNIISDVTGSRRFLILGVTAIDLKAISGIDYDLLWSEAYNYFHVQGNKVRVDFDTIEGNNQQYKFVNAEEEYLERHFDFTKESNTIMSATQVLDFLKIREPNLHTDSYKLGKALTSKGAKTESKRWEKGSNPTKRYHLHMIEKACEEPLSVTKSGSDDEAFTHFDLDDFFTIEKSVVA